jgi:mannose-6-phosphate isomerase-like protein (cupin superfamily)
MEKVSLTEKFALISGFWDPKIVGELNGQEVKAVRIKGEFVWHSHQDVDEMFLVIQGVLKMNLRDKVVTVHENEFLVVPKGVEHKPESPDEAWILLFEPAATLNTGNVINEFTRHNVEKI